MILIFQCFGHGHLIQFFIGLSPQGIHSRPFTRIEHAHLQARQVCIDSHLTAQGIDFPYKMALARPAYSRITGHECNIIKIQRRHQCPGTQTGTGQSCFTAGMAGTDDDDVIRIYYIHGNSFPFAILLQSIHYLPRQNRLNISSTISS